jgi:arylsulfatase
VTWPSAAADAGLIVTGGTIKRLVIDVSGELYVDLEREAEAMLARE